MSTNITLESKAFSEALSGWVSFFVPESPNTTVVVDNLLSQEIHRTRFLEILKTVRDALHSASANSLGAGKGDASRENYLKLCALLPDVDRVLTAISASLKRWESCSKSGEQFVSSFLEAVISSFLFLYEFIGEVERVSGRNIIRGDTLRKCVTEAFASCYKPSQLSGTLPISLNVGKFRRFVSQSLDTLSR